ncbi:MAG: outer membrane beta-barrel domain-containing protein [Bdellovibrionaceae bacterium]|nr:outer membrane beta-barrel domain-containing protein [Pseudobdellovibrionaceae bacterium]NUM59229.1 outer membrane beta-barrel domain-containing protein [Pseudobdellovibrionaceae bacterium]
MLTTEKKALSLLLLLLIGFSSFAQNSKDTNKPDETKKFESNDSDKLDIQKLEQKYWSAKDDDFTVIQNRAFQKEKRFFLTGSYGIPFNDPNAVGSLMGINFGYFLNERWGFEVSTVNANFKFNDTVDYFRNRYGVLPNHNTFKSANSIMAYFVPIYAKMSLLDKKIIYFDMGIGLGLGQTNYEENSCTLAEGCTAGASIDKINKASKSSSHYAFSIMQQFFLSEHWAVRIDLINRYTNEDRIDSTNKTSIGNKLINDTAFQIGVTFWK